MKKSCILITLTLLLALAFPLQILASTAGNNVTTLLSGLTATVSQGGNLISPGDTMTGDPVSVYVTFGVPVLGDEPEPPPDHYVKHGDYAEFTLSSGFVLTSGSSFDLRSGPILIGHLSITTQTDPGTGVKTTVARVDFDGDDTVYNGTSSLVSIYFLSDLLFDSSQGGGGAGSYAVKILSKNYTVLIPPTKAVYGIQKSGIVDFANRTVTWTAEVSATQEGAPLNLAGYVFEDNLTSAGEYIASTFKVNNIPQTPVYNPSSKLITYEFLTNPTSRPVQVTYQTYIDDNMYYSEDQVTLNNRAALKDSNSVEVTFDSATVSFSPGWIEKSGVSNETGGPVYNPTNRTITWTVLVNSRDLSMESVVVTDALPAGLTWQSAALEHWNGTSWETAVPIVPVSDDYYIGNITARARLTIVASVPDDAYTTGITTYTNSASVTWDGLPTGIPSIGSGGVGVGVGFIPITKSGSANTKTGQVSWNVSVDVQGQTISDLAVYDLLVYGAAVPGSLSVMPSGVSLASLTPRLNQRYAGNFSGSVGLSIEVITLSDGSGPAADLLKITGLSPNVNTFSFRSQIVNPAIFAGNTTNTVQNTATLFSGSTRLNQATAETGYDGRFIKKSMLKREAIAAPTANADLIAGDLAAGFDYADKSVIFRLNVNVNGMNFGTLKNAADLAPGSVTISDSLPIGWEFTEIVSGQQYLIFEGSSVSGAGDVLVGANPPVTVTGLAASVSGGSASFTFTGLDKPYVILVKAKPTADTLKTLFNDNKTTIAGNIITATTAGWTGYSVSSTQNVSVISNALGKSATRPLPGELHWTLDYRPYGVENLISSPAYITDMIPQGADLRTNASGVLILPGNISANELILNPDGSYTVGDPVTLTLGGNLTYDNATRILRFNIPDSTKGYRLNYITDITGDPGTTLTNQALLYGKIEGGTGVQVSFVISSADAGASLLRGGWLEITKYDGLGRSLPGAEYSVLNGTTVIRKGITSSSGILLLRVIPVGDYILRETGVPAGYLTDPDHTVKVQNVSGTIITTIDGKTGPLSNTLAVRNITTDNADVHATKVWSGGLTSEHTSSLVLTLYANGVAIDNTIIPPVITQTSPFVFDYKWEKLPVTDAVGTIVYTVNELTVPAGYVKTINPLTPLVITNEYRIQATKTWVNGSVLTRPTVYLRLYYKTGTGITDISPVPVPSGEEYKALVYPATSVEWLGIDADNAGVPYTFTVREFTYDGTNYVMGPPASFGSEIYRVEYTDSLAVEGVATVVSATNSYVSPVIPMTATKIWVGRQTPRPTVWFRLERRTSAGAWGAAGNWTDFSFGLSNKELPDGVTSVTFTDLDATDLQGRTYEFRVMEVNASNVLLTPQNYTKTESGLTVTNSYTVGASKVWENGRFAPKPNLWFRLYRQIGSEDPVLVPGIVPLQLPSPSYTGGETSKTVLVSWNGLDAEDELGNDYIFTVREGSYDGTTFTESIPLNFSPIPSGTTITNSYVIPTDAVVTANKTWLYGTSERPTVWFKLYRSTTAAPTPAVVTSAPVKQLDPGASSVQWTGLERTDLQGRAYTFTVVEGRYNAFTDVFTPGAPAPYIVSYIGLAVTNTYTAAGALTLSGSKTLSGRALAAGEFTFEVYAGSVATGTPIRTVTNAAAAAGVAAPFSFTAIPYTLADVGNKTYTVVERLETKGGVSFAANTYQVTVTIADKGDGTLIVVPSANYNSLYFTNTYTATGSLTLSGRKTLTGRALAAGEFTFEVYAGNTATGTPVRIIQNPAVAAGVPAPFSFAKFDYTLADVGSKTYTVVEKLETKGGVVYAANTYTVTVTIADKGDGTLAVAPSANYNSLNFSNNYTKATGTSSISGTKALTGRSLADGEFRFQLTGAGLTTPLTAVNVGGNFTIQLPTYTYDPANGVDQTGLHTYTLREIVGSLPGVSYDNLIQYVIEVRVTYTLGNSALTVTPMIKDAAGVNEVQAAFSNAYTKAAGTASIVGTKSLTGRSPANNEFTFHLLDSSDAVVVSGTNTGGIFTIQLPTYTYDPAIGVNQTGLHTYTLKELAGSLPGVSYDTLTQYTVEVRVDYTLGNSVLSVIPTIKNMAGTVVPAVFSNTYTMATGMASISGSKALTGRSLANGEFTFQLLDNADAVAASGTNMGRNFTMQLPTYTYDPANGINQTGLHTYTLKEFVGSLLGVSYDSLTQYSVEVQVDYTLGNSILTVTPTIRNMAETIAPAVFTNTYTAPDTVSAVQASKELTGRALKDGEFSFELYKANSFFETIDPMLETVTNNALGQVNFTPITYTDQDLTVGNNVSTYYYVIKEIVPDPKLGGVTYNTENLTVHAIVTVRDNGLGVLIVETAYARPGTLFKNTYAVSDTTAAIQVSKNLTGRALLDSEFSFELYAANDAFVTSGAALDMQPNLSGLVTFDPITYTDGNLTVGDNVSTYYYVVKEVVPIPKLGGVTYDGLEVHVIITVTDNGKGALDAVAAYSDDTEFNNTYTPPDPLLLDFTAIKSLINAKLTDDAFSFELYDGNEKLLASVTNEEGGAVTFPQVKIVDAGEYQFTIREKAGSEPNMLYDKTIYKALVTVTLVEAAWKMAGDLVIEKDDRPYEGDLSFRNTLVTPAPTQNPDYNAISVPVGANKKLTNRTLKAGEFAFILKDAAGNTVSTRTNDAGGKVVFDTQRFRKPGLYLYTVTEVKGSAKNMSYDDSVFTIRVNVTASGGELSAKLNYLKNGVPYAGDATFENLYKLPATGDNQPALIASLSSAAMLLLLLAIGLREKDQLTAKNKRKLSR